MGQHPTPPGVELLDVCQTILTGERRAAQAPEYIGAFDAAEDEFHRVYHEALEAAKCHSAGGEREDLIDAHNEAVSEALQAFVAVYVARRGERPAAA